MSDAISRRAMLAGLAASPLLLPNTASTYTTTAPVAPVATARCKTYQPSELVPVLDGMFDKLGGLRRLVQGKTVAIKLNFNGGPTVRLGHLPLGDTHWPHPNLLAAAMHLMARAGVHRVRLVEGAAASRTDPFEEHMLDANVRRGAVLQPLGVSFALHRLAGTDAGVGADRQFRHPVPQRRGHRVGPRKIRVGAPE